MEDPRVNIFGRKAIIPEFVEIRESNDAAGRVTSERKENKSLTTMRTKALIINVHDAKEPTVL